MFSAPMAQLNQAYHNGIIQYPRTVGNYTPSLYGRAHPPFDTFDGFSNALARNEYPLSMATIPLLLCNQGIVTSSTLEGVGGFLSTLYRNDSEWLTPKPDKREAIIGYKGMLRAVQHAFAEEATMKSSEVTWAHLDPYTPLRELRPDGIAFTVSSARSREYETKKRQNRKARVDHSPSAFPDVSIDAPVRVNSFEEAVQLFQQREEMLRIARAIDQSNKARDVEKRADGVTI